MVSRAGQGLVQLHLADDVPQGGGGQVLNGVHGLLHAVGVQLGVRDLEVDHRVDLHGDVVLGDDRLGREVRHLLLQGHLLGDPLDERQLHVEANAPHRVEGAQPLHHIGLGLLDDVDIADDQDQHQHHKDDSHGQSHNLSHLTNPPSFTGMTKSFTPSMDATSTCSPAGITSPSALRAVQVLPST